MLRIIFERSREHSSGGHRACPKSLILKLVLQGKHRIVTDNDAMLLELAIRHLSRHAANWNCRDHDLQYRTLQRVAVIIREVSNSVEAGIWARVKQAGLPPSGGVPGVIDDECVTCCQDFHGFDRIFACEGRDQTELTKTAQPFPFLTVTSIFFTSSEGRT